MSARDFTLIRGSRYGEPLPPKVAKSSYRTMYDVIHEDELPPTFT